MEDKLKVVLELKEGIEIVLTPSEYSAFVSTFFKPFCDILRTVPPQFADTPEHKLRSTVVDILTRLPQNEVLRNHIVELYDVCLNVTQNDNQDNALPAIKLLLDLQKSYRSFLETQASQLAQFLIKVRGGGNPGEWPRVCKPWRVAAVAHAEAAHAPKHRPGMHGCCGIRMQGLFWRAISWAAEWPQGRGHGLRSTLTGPAKHLALTGSSRG